MPSKNEDNAKKEGKNQDDVDAWFNYKVVVKTSDNTLVKLEGNVPLPMFLDPIAINQSEINFKKIFEAILVDPVKLQIQTKIRDRQRELKNLEEEKNIEKSIRESNDVFMLDNAPKAEPEKEIKDDKQQESSSDNPSEGREQGNPEQEHSDGEWDTPDPVSG